MSETEKIPTPTFPQARLDAMKADADGFDKRNPPTDVSWRFDGHSNLDAAESAFIARQLEHMRLGVIEVKYPGFKGAQLVPTNTEADTGDEQFTVKVMDQAGEVKVTRDMDGIIPSVEMKVTSVTVNFFALMLSYRYTIQEARAALKAGVPLIPKKAMICRSQMERKLDDIYFRGEASVGAKGLLNLSAPGLFPVTTTGLGGSKKFSDKAPDDILADLNGAPAAMVTTTDELFIPDTWVLPVSVREHINGRRVGDGTSESILSYFMRNNAHITTIESTFKSETAGVGSVTRSVLYKKDPNNLECLVSQPFEQFQPQAEGAAIVTTCHMRTGGVILYQPLSMNYADGF
jgi:hypothetical protein